MYKVERAIIMAAGLGNPDKAGDIKNAEAAGPGKRCADD